MMKEKKLRNKAVLRIYKGDSLQRFIIQTSAKRKKTKFIGELLCCYLTDEGGATLSIDLICLELVIGSPAVLYECPARLGEDVVRLRCLILFLGLLK